MFRNKNKVIWGYFKPFLIVLKQNRLFRVEIKYLKNYLLENIFKKKRNKDFENLKKDIPLPRISQKRLK
jgi:hypothetical protein